MKRVPQRGTGATRPTVAAPTAQPSPSATPTALPLSQATSGAPSPLDAVLGFYTNVAFHRFDQATALWSPTMQATNPPDEYIVARFTPTQRLFVQNATVTARDDAAGTATVSVQVQEAYGSPAVTRTWTGTWQLVRGPRGWLLDRAQLAQA